MAEAGAKAFEIYCDSDFGIIQQPEKRDLMKKTRQKLNWENKLNGDFIFYAAIHTHTNKTPKHLDFFNDIPSTNNDDRNNTHLIKIIYKVTQKTTLGKRDDILSFSPFCQNCQLNNSPWWRKAELNRNCKRCKCENGKKNNLYWRISKENCLIIH